MTELVDPFKDFKDPFVPEVEYVRLPDGSDAVDLGVTAMNHIETPLPKVDSSNLQQGDVITVEFDNNHREIFEVGSAHIGSLVFGSDDVRRPEVILKRKAQSEDESTEVKLYGSAISPLGMMRTPGTIRVGSFMITDMGVSTGTIRNFDLKRPDENGDLQPVMLNKTEKKTESDSFAYAKQAFREMSALLEADGFKFGDLTQDEVLPDGSVLEGGLNRYKKVDGNQLIYAARQGFGCAITPQDEIWVYDAKEEVLRAIRNIPTEGIIQMAVAEGVTKDIFQKAGSGYRDGTIPDWREPFLDSAHIHRLADSVPVTSHTWLRPDQEQPVITVLENGEGVSSLLRTLKRKGAAFVENMKAHGGEDLMESISQILGIDPNDSNYVFGKLEVDIRPGEEPEPREGDAYVWTSDELAKAAAKKVREAMSITYKKDGAILTIDSHNIHIKTDIAQEIDKMTKATKQAMGTTYKAIG